MKINLGLLGALLLLVAPAAWAQGFLWEVRSRPGSPDSGTRHWLLGSIHMLPASAYPLPEEYEQAFASVQGVIFETDIATVSSPAFSARLMAEVQAKDGLKAELDPGVWQSLQTQLTRSSLPGSFCEPFKAWFCSVTLEIVTLMRNGLSPEWGVDPQLHARALADGKTVAWLEAPETQIQIFSGADPTLSERMLKEQLRSMNTPGVRPMDLVDAWQRGDRAPLEAAVAEMRSSHPDLYGRLLAERNRAWIRPLQQKLSGDRPWLVVVGAAHLVGQDSVQELLSQRGYVIRSHPLSP